MCARARACMRARVCVCSIAQSCPTPCDPMDCNPPGSSGHGVSQARILKWVAITYPRELPDQGLNPCLLHLLHWQAGTLHCTTWEAVNLPLGFLKTVPSSDSLIPLTCFHCHLYPSLLGSSLGRIQGYPRDEGHRQGKPRETSLDRAKSARERERERE